MVLVLAVAADGEIRGVGERGEQVEVVPRGGLRHLGPVLPLERVPLARRPGLLRLFHGFRAGREVREPDVVVVALRYLGFRHAARRPPYRADAQTLASGTRGTESHDSDCHGSSCRAVARAGHDSTPGAATSQVRRRTGRFADGSRCRGTHGPATALVVWEL